MQIQQHRSPGDRLGHVDNEAHAAIRFAVLAAVAGVAFLIVAALGLFLQFGIAEPIYEWIPGAVFIQFPWRLLAVITPALIAEHGLTTEEFERLVTMLGDRKSVV